MGIDITLDLVVQKLKDKGIKVSRTGMSPWFVHAKLVSRLS